MPRYDTVCRKYCSDIPFIHLVLPSALLDIPLPRGSGSSYSFCPLQSVLQPALGFPCPEDDPTVILSVSPDLWGPALLASLTPGPSSSSHSPRHLPFPSMQIIILRS